MVFTIKLTTAAAAAVTAMAPSCATAGGGAISPHTITIARRMAIEDLRLPIMHDEKNSLTNCMGDSPRYRGCAHSVDRPRQLLGQFGNIGQAHGEFRCQRFVSLEERQTTIRFQEPGAIHPLP